MTQTSDNHSCMLPLQAYLKKLACLITCQIVGMAPRNQERVVQVRVLRDMALKYEVHRVPDNAGRERVGGMVHEILAAGLSEEDRVAVDAAWRSYELTWGSSGTEVNGADEPVSEEPIISEGAGEEKEWKFSAAQLTYNGTAGDWRAGCRQTLENLFDRFVLFIRGVMQEMHAKGLSATMECSMQAGDHVHIHAYFHLEKPFHKRGRDALAVFRFDGIRPHIEVNHARGNAYQAAVNRGHFYVVVDKIGSLFSHTDYHPWQAYAVEAWWLDGWLKQGKLTWETYLSLCAKVWACFLIVFHLVYVWTCGFWCASKYVLQSLCYRLA